MIWEAIEETSALLQRATGTRSVIGIPNAITAGMCGILLNEVPISFDLAESGGESDLAITLSAYDCQGVTGSRAGDVECVKAVLGHIDSLKALIENDVTLGGRVQQVRLAKASVYSGPSSDNSYEAFAEMTMEVNLW